MNSRAKDPRIVVNAKNPPEKPSVFPRPSSDAGVSKSGAPVSPRILVVEDQEDVRRMMATALEIEGYLVDEASSAQDGLRHLRLHHYDLILTDYAMPGGTGAWMLREASRLGLLTQTVALIVTAHPDVRELANVQVINKPLDLDYFLDEVRDLAGPAQRSTASRPAEFKRNGSDGAANSAPVELVLYVSSTSQASAEAQQNLDRLLRGVDRSRVTWSVIDLAANPWAGAADRVAFTPTLVKRFPRPMTWILGNLRDTSVVADLLRSSGIDVAR